MTVLFQTVRDAAGCAAVRLHESSTPNAAAHGQPISVGVTTPGQDDGMPTTPVRKQDDVRPTREVTVTWRTYSSPLRYASGRSAPHSNILSL